MKKFFVFVLLFISVSSIGQSASPSANTFTEMMSDYRGEMGSGNFVYNALLFDLATISTDFNFKGQIYYNAQAAASVYTGEGIIGKGWGADFLPTIYRSVGTSSVWDEAYYKISTNQVMSDYQPYSRPNREANDLFEFNVFGLNGSFRLLYNANNTVSVQLVSSNAFVEIVPNCLIANNGVNGKIINLKGFTVIDSNGFSYRFEEAENSGIFLNLDPANSLLIDPNNDSFNGFLPYNRSFMLTDIADKHQRKLVQYIYKSYASSVSQGSKVFNYNQKVIDQINVIDKYNIVFTTNRSKITKVNINSNTNEPIQNITLARTGIAFFNKDNVKEKGYGFSYFAVPMNNYSVNSQGNYLKADYCALASPSLIYDNKIQNYTAGLLHTINLPYKGKVNIEYENNTYNFSGPAEIWNESSYIYTEVPVTYNYNGGNDSYSFYYNALNGAINDESYYVKFHSTLFSNPLIKDENNNPISIYPGLITYANYTPKTMLQGFDFQNQCPDYGEKIKHNTNYNNRVVALERSAGNPSNISNVKVYKKTLKPENQRLSYCYGPSVRVKKITETDNTNVVSEKKYTYIDPANNRRSSGIITTPIWYQQPNAVVFYRHITIEESGKGQITYQTNWDGVFAPNTLKPDEIIYNIKNSWKYKDNGELVEHISNNFETYPASSDPKANQKIKKINTTINTYEGLGVRTTSAEKLFDTISMLPVYNKITEEAVNETFYENYIHEKLGNAYYQTQVEKFKNGIPLNRSVFEYGQYGNTQAYNLWRTKVAKSTLPLEIEKEITSYDAYGNVLEYKTKEGILVSQIWGYNNSKLVAELKNISYASISSATISTIKSTSASTTYNEANLVTALNSLRTSFPNGFVTTYTYNPLVGISSITDVNGRKETYQYDTFNRLYRVLNNEGLIVKEYNYNIKQF